MKKSNLLTITCVTAMSALLGMTACSEGDDTPDDNTTTTGGTTSSGGGSSTGGTAMGGGSTGGTPSTGGGSSGPTVTFTFASDLEGMVVDYEENLGMGGGTFSSLSHDASDGEPDAGSAKLEVPFDYTGDGTYDELQKAHVAIPLDEALDLTGETASVKVKLVSGGSSAAECPLVAKMFLKTTEGYVWGNGMEGNLEEGSWITLSIAASSPSYNDTGYDESDVRMVGVEVTPNTGTDCVSSDAVVLIDTITL